MPVTNVVDSRTNKYKVECKVIIEPSWHDNSVKGSTRFVVDDENDFMIDDDLEVVSVGEALVYAKKNYSKTEVTVYLYDVE